MIADTGAWGTPWLRWALGELGIAEIPGIKEHPRIRYYHTFTAAGEASEEVAWCSSFVNAAMQAGANIRGTRNKAASSWETWGEPCALRVGAVAFFGHADPDAKGTGHVNLVVGWSDTHVWCVGGNQGNAVSVAKRRRVDMEACRWPAGVP